MKTIQKRQIMRTMNVALLAISLSGALLLSCAGQDTALPAVFGDGADAKLDRVDNVHQVRFVEIFLVGREPGTGDVVAAVYNTMYTPQGIPEWSWMKKGIEIYIAAKKPDAVPSENWLPIERKDLDMNMVLRLYAPDLEKMKTWKAPKAEKL